VTERIPLFPLGAVLYPGLMLPLHIFEDRYRALVRDLVAGRDDQVGNQLGNQPNNEGAPYFGVVAIRAGREVGAAGVEGLSALHEVGCTAELRGVEEYEDGRDDIVTTGSRRFRLLGLDTYKAYLQAEVEWLD